MAPDLVLFGEIVQIPANGLGLTSKWVTRSSVETKPLPGQDVQDLQMSLGLFHACTPQMRRKRPRQVRGLWQCTLILFQSIRAGSRFMPYGQPPWRAIDLFSCLRSYGQQDDGEHAGDGEHTKPPSQPKWSTV